MLPNFLVLSNHSVLKCLPGIGQLDIFSSYALIWHIPVFPPCHTFNIWMLFYFQNGEINSFDFSTLFMHYYFYWKKFQLYLSHVEDIPSFQPQGRTNTFSCFLLTTNISRFLSFCFTCISATSLLTLTHWLFDSSLFGGKNPLCLNISETENSKRSSHMVISIHLMNGCFDSLNWRNSVSWTVILNLLSIFMRK